MMGPMTREEWIHKLQNIKGLPLRARSMARVALIDEVEARGKTWREEV